jgi:hypothetical protein
LAAVAATEFAFDADDLSGFGSEIREVGPGELEFSSVAPGRFRSGDLGSLELEVFEGRQIADAHAGFYFRLRERRPEHVERSRPELSATQLSPTAGIQVEFDGIAVPDLIVWSEMRWMLIEAAEPDVKILLVPEKKELAASIGEVGMSYVDGRNESAVPVVEFAIQDDLLLRLRNQTNDLSMAGTGKENRQ